MLCVILLILVGSLYLYSIRTYDYWKRRGVKHDTPVPLLGTNAKGYLMQRSKTQLASDMYWKYPNERVVGFFRARTPELIIRDPELVKFILHYDFDSFSDRGVTSHQEYAHEPLARHLFNADGDLWRLLRQRLTPALTSRKLKAMFPLIVERAERLHVRIQAAAGAPIDARDLMARFTTDVTGACLFGIDTDALRNDDSEFIILSKKIVMTTGIDTVKDLLRETFPSVLGNRCFRKKFQSDFFLAFVRAIISQRNCEPSGQNDFIDLLLEYKKQGIVVSDSAEKFDKDGSPQRVKFEMTDDLMAAQAFMFYAAGVEPPSSTASFTLHLLAYYPDIQKKVLKDIDRVLAKHKALTYDAIQEMFYLEWAFKESMRMFPSVGVLLRQCRRKYKFPGMDLIIDKGVKITIPVQALHNDPKYFENPEEFRPERFNPKLLVDTEKTKYVYLPFGDGLRSCIGVKMGLMLSIAGLVAVLSKFSVEPTLHSVRYPNLESTPLIIQSVKDGLPLLFRVR